ncbi:hypothetical protein DICVIV_00894 [Dictyocaulus viviparus]|uniref:Uncharacterized protein n=1 Tax=Dictyocaulus viviparus TaxID=29172 RepID=A0A0D8YA42_DICVI|nr:hypothetical protein DICVIV_00894 [Dictyocaulus viviparus]
MNGYYLNQATPYFRPFKKTKRVLDEYDGIRRVRSALDKCLRENSPKCSPNMQSKINDSDKLFERQSSSDQLSDDGENIPSASEISNVEDGRVLPSVEVQSSRSITPASTMSSGVDRITELLDKMNSFGRHPTPDQKYNRFVAERRELRDREIALQEEVRIRNLARLCSREHIEEQARRRLQLIGIHVPLPKPKIKDEFPIPKFTLHHNNLEVMIEKFLPDSLP